MNVPDNLVCVCVCDVNVHTGVYVGKTSDLRKSVYLVNSGIGSPSRSICG